MLQFCLERILKWAKNGSFKLGNKTGVFVSSVIQTINLPGMEIIRKVIT